MRPAGVGVLEGKGGPDLPGEALGWSARGMELGPPSRKSLAAAWTRPSGLRLRVTSVALLHASLPSPTLQLTRASRWCPDCDTVFLSCQFQGCLKGPQGWPKHLGVGQPACPFSWGFPDLTGMFVSPALLGEGHTDHTSGCEALNGDRLFHRTGHSW